MRIVYLSSWPTGGAEKINYQWFLDPNDRHAKNVNMSTNTNSTKTFQISIQKHFKLDKRQKLM